VRIDRRHAGAALILAGLALPAPAASAEPAASCPQAFAIGCVPDAGGQISRDMVIYFDASSGSGPNYFVLKPHGPSGRTRRCTDAEVLIEETSVRFSLDRRTGRYRLVDRRFDGTVVEAAGVCRSISLPGTRDPQ
jgi:hypothetical protein